MFLLPIHPPQRQPPELLGVNPNPPCPGIWVTLCPLPQIDVVNMPPPPDVVPHCPVGANELGGHRPGDGRYSGFFFQFLRTLRATCFVFGLLVGERRGGVREADPQRHRR